MEQKSGHMSVSLFKEFQKCEARGKAIFDGDYKWPESEALLVGSYVDQKLTGTDETFAKFIESHPGKILKKDGTPYAYLSKADNAIDMLKKQPLAVECLNGEHQVTMEGELEGVPVKGIFDTYRPGEWISDLKYVRALRTGANESIISAYGYDLQAALYQELVFQNTGKRLPFYFVLLTKDDVPRTCVCQISQQNMDKAMEVLKNNIGHYWSICTGETMPERCGICDYCAQTVTQDKPIDSDLIGLSNQDMNTVNDLLGGLI